MKKENLIFYPGDIKRLYNIKHKIFKRVGLLDASIKKGQDIDLALKEIEKKPLNKGSHWRSSSDYVCFNFTKEIPMEYRESNLVAVIDASIGGLVMLDDGSVIDGAYHDNKKENLFNPFKNICIYKIPKNTDRVSLWLLSSSKEYNILKGTLNYSSLAIMDNKIYEYYYDYLALSSAFYTYNGYYRKKIREILEKSYKAFRANDAILAHALINNFLNNGGSDDLSIGTFFKIDNSFSNANSLDDLHSKVSRYYASAINNMRDYPNSVYLASSIENLAWLKKKHKDLFNELKKYHDNKQFYLEGGMWSSTESTIPSGEALIRQFIYGMRFIEEEFNEEAKALVCDASLYKSPALPQILKKSGLDYLIIKNAKDLKSKKSFSWQGLANDSIYTYLLASNYSSFNALADEAKEIKEDYLKSSSSINEALACLDGDSFSKSNLELINRYENTYGLPKLKMEEPKILLQRLSKDLDTPDYKGELNLNNNKESYFKEANLKKNNRRCEHLLHIYEALGSAAIKEGYKYQRERIEKIWKDVLLFQSSSLILEGIKDSLYQELSNRYNEIIKELNALINEVFAFLKRSDKGYSAYNPAPAFVSGYLKRKKYWYKYSLRPYEANELIEVLGKDSSLNASKNMIENNILSVRFSPLGYIESILDKKTSFEFNKGGLNVLNIYNKRGTKPKHLKPVSIKMYVEGLEAICETVYKYNKSKLIQKVILRKDLDYLIFDTRVDWNERDKILRADFHPSIVSSTIDYDIQFGNVKREINKKEEICAHKYIDMSTKKAGSSLFSDSKYSYIVAPTLMSLNIIEPNLKNNSLDNNHHFKYAYYPHLKNKDQARVIDKAYEFNYKPIILDGFIRLEPLAYLDNNDIIIETMKPSEDLKGIVLRLYESKGHNNSTSLMLNLDYNKLYEGNLRELNKHEINRSLCFSPYEIKTIIIE